jgi:hypothetical protein
MSSLNVVLRNKQGDPNNVLRGTLKNALRLLPNAQIGLSAINISRPIQQITIEKNSLIGLQLASGSGINNTPGYLMQTYVKAGNYTRASLASSVQRSLNKCCYPFCSQNLQGNSNASLIGFIPNQPVAITGSLMNTAATTHAETLVTLDGNKFNFTRYNAVPISLVKGDLTDFSNASANIAPANPPTDGSFIVNQVQGNSFSCALNKPQSTGSFSFSFNYDMSTDTSPAYVSLSASSPNVSIQWQVQESVDQNLNRAYSISIAVNGIVKMSNDIAIDGNNIVDNMNFSFYRIAGRIGWCTYKTNSTNVGPVDGNSIAETDDITQYWSELAYTMMGRIYYEQNVTQYTFSNVMHTISQIPTEFQLPRIASSASIVNLGNPLSDEKLRQLSLMRQQSNDYDEDLGIFIVTQNDLSNTSEAVENIGAIDVPLCNFIPGEISSQLGFYFSGLPVNGQIPRYQFSASGPYSVISSDFSAVANGDVQPIIVASRSIPLRGVAFDEFGNSVDLSILDSITVDYSNGQTFQAYFRPPIYTSVANKSEMVLTDLRFDLLDIDGISPFDCLQGGSIVLNIRGASF